MNEESIIKYSNIIGQDSTFDDINKELDKLESRLERLAKERAKQMDLVNPNDAAQISKLSKEILEEEKALKQLNKQRQNLAKTKKRLNDLTDEELIQREKEKIANRERVQRAKQLAILRTQEKGSIAALRAQLSLVTLDWKKLTSEELKNSKQAKELVVRKKALTDTLKSLEKQTGDTRRNVGNYTDSLGRLGKVSAQVFLGRSAVDFFRRVASGVSTLIEKNKEGSASIAALDRSLSRAGSAFTKFAGLLLEKVAGALTFIVDTGSDILEFFSGVDEEAGKFVATSDELATSINTLNKEFSKELATSEQLFTAISNTNEGTAERKQLVDQINEQYGQYLPNLLTEKSTLDDIAEAQRLVNDALTKGFLIRIEQATQTDIFTNKVTAQRDAFQKLQEIAERSGKTIDSSLLGAFSELIENFDETSKIGSNARDVIESVAFSGAAAGRELESINPSIAELTKQLKGVADSDFVIDFLSSVSVTNDKYNESIGDTQAALSSLQKELITYDKNVSGNTKNTQDNTKALQDNTTARLNAIISLQRQLEAAEVGNIEDAQEKALRLEELRGRAEREGIAMNFAERIALIEQQEANLILFFGENSKEVKAFREQAAKELLELERLNQRLSEEQLKASEKRKIDIRKKFALATNQLEAIDVTNQEEQFDKVLNERVSKVEQANNKIKESNDNLFDGLVQTSQKIGELITQTFEKQADLAEDNVKRAESSVEEARQRARDGLQNNLKFEQEQLAQRQAEQQRAQKRAQQAAKLTALFNIVAAAAASGDENAVVNGIVQFGLLEAFSAAIEGSFIDGTENVERDLGKSNAVFKDKVDNFLGVTKSGKLLRFDGKERIMNPSQNALLGDMSNDDTVKYALIGQQMSDLYDPKPYLDAAHYRQRTNEFLKATRKTDSPNFGKLEAKMDEVRRAIEKKPVVKDSLEKVTSTSATIARKITKGNMTRNEKIKTNL